MAQRLRDEAAEAAALRAEADRLTRQGLPVIDPAQAPDPFRDRCAMQDLRTSDGEVVPEADWPTVPGAAVVLVRDWEDPQTAGRPRHAGAPPGLGVHRPGQPPACTTAGTAHPGATAPAAATDQDREAAREQRRTVIANNKAWLSATTVRRAWLASC